MPTEDELDPVATQHLAEGMAEWPRLPREHTILALDDDHLGPEPSRRLRELDPRRARSEHDQSAGDRLHARGFTSAPDAVELGEAGDRRKERIGARCDDDVIGGVALAVDLDRAYAVEPPVASDEVDAPGVEPFHRAVIGVVRHHEVAPCKRGLDVDLCLRSRLDCGLHGLAGAQQALRRDARPIRALPSDPLALDHRDAQATFSQRTRAVLTRCTRAEDDDVVVAAHAGDRRSGALRIAPVHALVACRVHVRVLGRRTASFTARQRLLEALT